MTAAEAVPSGYFITNVVPVVDDGDAIFGPIVVRVLNYEGEGGKNHLVVAVGATEPGEYRVVFEGEVSDITKTTPNGEVVEGYLHFSGEWPS